MAKLIKKRDSLIFKQNNFAKFIEDLQENERLDDLQLMELQNRIKKYELLFIDYDSLQTEIECAARNAEDEFQERDTFENKFYSLMSKAELLFNKFKVTKTKQNVEEMPKNSFTKVTSVRLPSIDLPKYDGNFESWLEFHDTFTSLINNNSDISDIQKFHYLRSCLIGSAAEVISSIGFSSENYHVAWDILYERYNNSHTLINNHVRALFNLEPVVKESSIKIRNLIDSYSKHLRSLEKLKEPVNQWDTLIIHIIVSKLDPVSVREWEEFKIKDNKPTLITLTTFLRGRADLLENINSLEQNVKFNIQTKPTNKGTTFNQFTKQHFSNNFTTKGLYTNIPSCAYCKKDHLIFNCPEYLNLSVKAKFDFAKQAKLCINCLKPGHYNRQCNFGPCQKCTSKHNTLLHEEKCSTTDVIQGINSTALSTNAEFGQVLLSTCTIKIYDKYGNSHLANALLDSGSSSSFLTTNLSNRLGLEKVATNISVLGINNSATKIKYKNITTIESCSNAYKTELSCYIIDEITGTIPSAPVDVKHINIPPNIKLANPTFYKPTNIDILIGADLFWDLICIGQIKLGPGALVLQKTKFGWVVSGPTNVQIQERVRCNVALERQLARFWEIEEYPSSKCLSSEEKTCELNFKTTTYQNDDGRFVVQIPLKDSPLVLGESKSLAIKCFNNLEKKFKFNDKLKSSYTDVINEYKVLGHMTNVTDLPEPTIGYYMPHHAVIKEDAKTSKVRVVYNASAKSSKNISFNDIQIIGPTIQDSLFSILLRFRKHQFVVTADVRQMYRQILVEDSQRDLQRIVWRDSPDEKLQTYRLNTVTFGTAAAPYLAIRCLFELASNIRTKNPKIANIIEKDFYVDDLLTGAETLDELTEICNEISSLFRTGCFELHKWQSNTINFDQNNPVQKEFCTDQYNKTLGLYWNSHNDVLKYSIISTNNDKVNKRIILSYTSKIFDPLGLLSPCIIISKTIMQKLWSEKISWDEGVSAHIYEIWRKFQSDLQYLNNVIIPRHVICKYPIKIDLHGFSDASQVAYGASVYVRSVDNTGKVFVHLLCAKSKVAPLKPLTIPRLELCGALVLARLAKIVIESLDINFNTITFWSDSSIVLGWLKHEPNTLTTFVCNRIAEIQDITKGHIWRHCPTLDNPSDLLSRGMSPALIQNCNLWWHGPEWLGKQIEDFPNSLEILNELPEFKKEHKGLTTVINTNLIDFDRFSNVNRLKRCMAYVLRFISNCKANKSERKTGNLSIGEINVGFQIIIKFSQIQSFKFEIDKIENNKMLDKGSKLISLNPFLDAAGLLRVGGCLSNSSFDYDKKYPIILCAKHILSKLIFMEKHSSLLHGGPQLLLATIREQFWPIGGRNLAKYIVKNCIVCFRANPKIVIPMMGNLPSDRLRPGTPFEVTGVDYAGPFLLKTRAGRGGVLTKCWISLFVCFVTHAIHIELVSSLETDKFIMALRRFVSRRSAPKIIYSDNGTNFVGADNQLKQFFDENKNIIEEKAIEKGIDWKFIPASSPHFGGIWEAGVKSTKFHLKRVMGDAHLTFEEFYTILTQVEAILNSRPLIPISSHINDLTPLTPAHLIMGKSLTTLPQHDVKFIQENRLLRFERVQQMLQNFWERWSKEYVGELQQRSKWKQSQGELKCDTLVLIKEDNQPPMKWKLGRVVQLHPGKDSINRVASIKTNSGIIKRAFSKICPLPLE